MEPTATTIADHVEAVEEEDTATGVRAADTEAAEEIAARADKTAAATAAQGVTAADSAGTTGRVARTAEPTEAQPSNAL